VSMGRVVMIVIRYPVNPTTQLSDSAMAIMNIELHTPTQAQGSPTASTPTFRV
jgi:hypothetical protein